MISSVNFKAFFSINLDIKNKMLLLILNLVFHPSLKSKIILFLKKNLTPKN